MCGIIGILGKDDVAARLVDGLQRLEYRGYDSAGIATLNGGGGIDRRRAKGKLVNLVDRVAQSPISGDAGIGHTRWATHGAPNETNAHPHATERVAVVHNGIIENFQELRQELEAAGRVFETETDTEVVTMMITVNLDSGMGPLDAVKACLDRLDGAFALAIIFAGEDDLMIGARRGTPLAVGYGDGEMFLGSDALALAPLTKRICYLAEGDWVEVRRGGAVVRDAQGVIVEREIRLTEASGALVGKGAFRHFMLKEIFEQPAVVGETLQSYTNAVTREVHLPPMPFDWVDVPRVTIVACGTSSYAALVAKYWLEQVARLPVEVDIASEFRYREAPLPPGGVALFISQSGETADTLAALRYCREHGQHIISVLNVAECSMARETDVVLQTLAGPEIGVASTKAFTTQLTVLAVVALAAARARDAIDREGEAALVGALTEVPSRMAEVLNHDERLREIAQQISDARDILYLGRGTAYPLALEGALKLKEISYIHAEGYAAGEMKHGPIALIDETVPVIVLAPTDRWFEKTASNVQEVIARGGKVICFSDRAGLERFDDKSFASVEMPKVNGFVAPLLYAIPVQLLAYHTAVVKGTDVDQPRNLAKSVTVE